jgi:hypothetical protein
VTRRTVTTILLLYLAVVWTAVLLRIDHFPLTWVPMYSVFKPHARLALRAEDAGQVRRGFRVRHRDGSTGWVGPEQLNISKWTMRRLYYKRAFDKGAPKVDQANQNLSPFLRRLYGLEPGEERYDADWEWRLFWSLNKTLGYEPDDPGFIVRIRAEKTGVFYSVPDLRFVKRKTRKSTIHWKEEWRSRWDAGRL